jgi:hypothetical protein
MGPVWLGKDTRDEQGPVCNPLARVWPRCGRARSGTAVLGWARQGRARHGVARRGRDTHDKQSSGCDSPAWVWGMARLGLARRDEAGPGAARQGAAGQGYPLPAATGVQGPGAGLAMAWQGEAPRGGVGRGEARQGTLRLGRGKGHTTGTLRLLCSLSCLTLASFIARNSRYTCSWPDHPLIPPGLPANSSR